MWRGVLTSLLVSSVASLPQVASAHPHIWIDSYYQINLAQPVVKTLNAHWTFDLFSSMDMLIAFDTNADGKLEGQEKAEAAQAMTNLAQYGYFLKIEVDDEPIKPDLVTITDLDVKDQQLTVDLGISLPDAVDLRDHPLRLGFGDSENYFALVIPDDGLIQLTGILAETCTPTPAKADAFYMEGWVDVTCDP